MPFGCKQLFSLASCRAAGKSKGKRKSKKKAADLDSVFAALDQNGASETGTADTDAGPVRADALTNGGQPDVEADEAAAFGKKKKKSSRQKGEVHAPRPKPLQQPHICACPDCMYAFHDSSLKWASSINVLTTNGFVLHLTITAPRPPLPDCVLM